MPFLSVLLPVYNGEALVAEAIQSVLSQPNGDLELVILNDGSKDSTTVICEKFVQMDKRVKLVNHTNVGLGKNRNIGIPLLTGEWVIFLDHDDLLAPNFYTDGLEQFLRLCEKKKIEVIVPARIRVDYEKTEYIFDPVGRNGVFDGHGEASWWIKNEFASLIYSNRLIQEKALFFEETRPEMETVFRHKAAYLAEKVLFTDDFYFSVRRGNPSSISNTWKYSSILDVRRRSYESLLVWHQNIDGKDLLSVQKVKNELIRIMGNYFSFGVKELTLPEFKKLISQAEVAKYLVSPPDYFPAKIRRICSLFRYFPTGGYCFYRVKQFITNILHPKKVLKYDGDMKKALHSADWYNQAYIKIENEVIDCC